MILPLTFIFLGLIGLWLGTKWIINGALALAQKFKLSHSFVGFAILAVGTDLPEVFVSIKAALNNSNGIESSGIITGNAIGSSISQITFILGVSGLFLTIKMGTRELLRDGIALLSSIVLLVFFSLDGLIAKWEGICMVAAYLLYYLILLKSQTGQSEDNHVVNRYSNSLLTIFMLSGFILLIASSNVVVENAMKLAAQWGVAQSYVGILIVGIGTSLPELAVSIGAALRKSAGLSVGNIIGSNIFDGLIPIGLAATISATKMEKVLLTFDMPFLLAVSVIVLLFLKTKKGISIIEGIVLISLFLLYLSLKLLFLD